MATNLSKSLAVALTIISTNAAIDCLGQAAKSNEQARQYPIEDFLDTTNYRGASFSPDKGKILVS